MKTSHALVTFVLQHLTKHLQPPPETLTSVHRLSQLPGDKFWLIKSPPQPPPDQRTALGKYNYFGSITILFSRLGGRANPASTFTQISRRGTSMDSREALPGHFIVNLGDAIVKLKNGLLRSNIQRVVIPPGGQAKETRHSLTYFARPEEDVILSRLEGSDVIPELEREE